MKENSDALKAFRKASKPIKNLNLDQDERIRWWVCYRNGQRLYERDAVDMADLYFNSGITPLETVEDAVEDLIAPHIFDEDFAEKLKDLIEEFKEYYKQ